MMQPMLPRVIPMQQPLKMLAHHRTAASAGRDDVFVRLEDLDEAFGQLARLWLESIVVKRLPAARLQLRKRDMASEMLEDFRDRDADVGIELVGQAGDEQSDVGFHRCAANRRGRRVMIQGLLYHSASNGRAGTMVGTMVLGEKAPVAAVELLRLFSKCH